MRWSLTGTEGPRIVFEMLRELNRNPSELDRLIEAKMRAAGIATPTITSFLGAVHKVLAGETGLLPESSIIPISSLPELDRVRAGGGASSLLQQLAVVKLNGGLGTSMGLDRVKSLIAVKGQETFLDFIARQIFYLRGGATAADPAFYLMDSFNTQKDTLDYLGKYPGLGENGRLDFLQNMVPKIDASTLEPVSWPAQPDLEWCPPGHGDLYPALLGSGLLEHLLAKGVKYLFVSNADNLGATVDLGLLRYFAEGDLSFLMEVAERTASDRKGGHLARQRANGRLVLRESAQCPKEDEAAFQDIQRHRFFNTNNLWVRLEDLKSALDRNGGALSLALIKNAKTVDARQPDSPKVLQLESAMGAAIECFEKAGAVVVPRTRFAPVKTTSDLLALRSDAYRVTEDFRLVLAEVRQGKPPVVDLDSQYYKLLPDFESRFALGIPSLLECDSIKVSGNVHFAAGVGCRGKVEFVNPLAAAKTVPAGNYTNVQIEF